MEPGTGKSRRVVRVLSQNVAQLGDQSAPSLVKCAKNRADAPSYDMTQVGTYCTKYM